MDQSHLGRRNQPDLPAVDRLGLTIMTRAPASRPALVVALTGGIGSGKSAVSKRLSERGAAVIDADLIAHALTAPGGDAVTAIAETFGSEMVDADGGLDRAAMRRLAFSDPTARRRLEEILHPRIRTHMLQNLSEVEAPYAVLVIPLLFETDQTDLADRILVVDVPERLQIERVKARSGLDEEEVRRIIRTQADRGARVAGAHDLIDNSGSLAQLLSRTDELHERYLQLAARAEEPPTAR
jgi:dephospho-CoA kinase